MSNEEVCFTCTPSEVEIKTLSISQSYEIHDHEKGLNNSFIHLLKLELHMRTKLSGGPRGRVGDSGGANYTQTVVCTLMLQRRSYDNE